MKLFAVCAPGLETLLAGELVELGLLKPRLFLGPPAEPGGVAFEGGHDALLAANRGLRLAERVLARLEPFAAPDAVALESGTAAAPWEEYLRPGRPLVLRAECRASRLSREKGVAETVAAGIGARLGAAPRLVTADEEPGAPIVYASVVRDSCRLSVDTSGEPLHRRGWRLETAKAPLRETLAAGLVRASGWDRVSPFLDPFCGSGTVAIEAALLARGVPPGGRRRFAFQDWPSYKDDGVGTETERAAASPPRVLASDRDAGAVAAAKANAERAGVAGDIEFSVRAVSAIEPPRGPGWVVTNPPYGVRVSEGKDLRDLYAGLGKVLRSKCGGWRVSLLTSDGRLARNAGLSLEPGLSTLNGGLSVTVWSGRA
ncbi:MAG: class I SAM-dependent RNA methyltransferase [Elusimicrobiota bacterium]|nr:class I SAM-dependent RNA methyltransferase [Elusimicrobiota bacterium]